MLLLFDLLLIAIVLVSVWAFVTQVYLPIVRGVPLFPVFRPKAILEKKVSEAREDVDEALLEKEAERLEKKAEEIKTK